MPAASLTVAGPVMTRLGASLSNIVPVPVTPPISIGTLSLPSKTESFVVGTETVKPITPGGTEIVFPMGSNVTPLLNVGLP